MSAQKRCQRYVKGHLGTVWQFHSLSTRKKMEIVLFSINLGSATTTFRISCAYTFKKVTILVPVSDLSMMSTFII